MSFQKTLFLVAALVLIIAMSDTAPLPSPPEEEAGTKAGGTLPRASSISRPSNDAPFPDIAPNQLLLSGKSPTDLPRNVRAVRENIIASRIANVNGDLLISETDSWRLTYIPTPDLFIVDITQEPVLEAKRGAQRLFLDFGLSQSDLCDLPVRFLLQGVDLRRAHPDFTSLPDGCAVPQ